MTYLATAILSVYRTIVSPVLHTAAVYPCGCRFFPTCSAYAESALRQYGLRRAFMLILMRVGRCHPWARGGYDPLPCVSGGRYIKRETETLA